MDCSVEKLYGLEEKLLDRHLALRYNIVATAEVAQLVEHATENRGVRSSILRLGTHSAGRVSGTIAGVA